MEVPLISVRIFSRSIFHSIVATRIFPQKGFYSFTRNFRQRQKKGEERKSYLGFPLVLPIVSLRLGVGVAVDVRSLMPSHQGQGAVGEGDRQQDDQEEKADHQQHLLNLQVLRPDLKSFPLYGPDNTFACLFLPPREQRSRSWTKASLPAVPRAEK